MISGACSTISGEDPQIGFLGFGTKVPNKTYAYDYPISTSWRLRATMVRFGMAWAFVDTAATTATYVELEERARIAGFGARARLSADVGVGAG